MMDKPLYRVAAAGLDPRDARLIEIVFRHSQYNRYAFQYVPVDSFDAVDILIVNTVEAEGLRALARMRTLGTEVPVVAAVPRGAPSSARHAISIDRLTLQLLPILNRVVELELEDPDTRPMSVEEANPPPRAVAATSPVRAVAAAARPAPASNPARPPTATPVAASSLTGPLRAPMAPPHAVGAVAAPVAPRPPAPPPSTPPRAPSASGRAPIPPATPAPARTASPGKPPTPVQGRTAYLPSPPGEVPRRRPEVPMATPVPQSPRRPAAADQAHTTAREGPAREGPLGQPPANLPVGGARVQVLVVDDSPTVRRQLTLAFDRMGVACDAVPSAVAGLERMAAIRYDLVLVDVVMPEVDGYQLTREIRRRHRGIPVIILTSRSSPFDLARGALSGCASYLVKPVTLRKLEASVIKVLRKTLAIDDLSGLLRPISLYAPASSRPSEPEGSEGPGGQ